MKAYYIFFIVLIFFSCKSLQTEKLPDICFTGKFFQPVEKVSLKDVEKIKELNEKFVEMEGILSYNFEDVALYPSKSADPPEGMWLDLRVPDTVPESLLYKLSGKKATIIGRVNLKKKGHYGGYIGTLDSAFCIKIK